MAQSITSSNSSSTRSMPDIAKDQTPTHQGTLNWVGMSHIDMPMQFYTKAGIKTVSASVDAYVSLEDSTAKGIHMSRLYLALETLSIEQALSPQSIKDLLQDFLKTHQGLSQAARVVFRFPFHLRRDSLLSGKTGWKAYPVELDCQIIDGVLNFYLQVKVDYSSTCPCSAALARQLIQEAFQKEFRHKELSYQEISQWLGSTEGIIATPHSQRSTADICIRLSDKEQAEFPVTLLVNAAEKALKTPVQAAVKREDEQEFARLNGQNPMFCEDAARILKAELLTIKEAADFRIQVNHYESLHPHNAVAIATKGIPGGMQP